MAVITNTFTTVSAKGNLEDVDRAISQISPEDSPILSMLSKEKTTSTSPDWLTQTLAPPADNAQLEGDQFTYGAVTPAVKYRNHTQTQRKEWIIAKSQLATDNAGQVEQLKTVRRNKVIELRKDGELMIVSNTASASGATRRSGGLPTWITTNASRGAGGVNGGFNTGTGLTAAETTGTQRPFTKALLDGALQQGYMSGANLNKVVAAPYVKSEFVKFMSDANVAPFRNMISDKGKNTVIGDVDMYDGPFGKVAFIMNRVMALNAATARRAFLLDTEVLSIKVFRGVQDGEVTPNADAKAGVVITEHTLAPKNEAGLGVIADIFGLTAAS